jgi:hypothetical protein
MMEGNGRCSDCKYHGIWWDEMLDGTFAHDGCKCNHSEGDKHYHFECCGEYMGNEKKTCPYYEYGPQQSPEKEKEEGKKEMIKDRLR